MTPYLLRRYIADVRQYVGSKVEVQWISHNLYYILDKIPQNFKPNPDIFPENLAKAVQLSWQKGGRAVGLYYNRKTQLWNIVDSQKLINPLEWNEYKQYVVLDGNLFSTESYRLKYIEQLEKNFAMS